MMLGYELLDSDQCALIDRIYECDEILVYATMGSGKTVCYLTAADELLRDGVVNRVLVVAPLNPCRLVWAREHEKWSHLSHLNVALAHGSPEQRKAAIESDAQIVVLNIENLVWFLDTYGKQHGFDALCIDELSKFGATGNNSVKRLRRYVSTFKHRVGLTGSPVHEGFDKLYAQVLMLDGGRRLGTSKDRFLNRFFAPDYNGYNWTLRAGADKDILCLLSDLIHEMPDYTHTLPELVEQVVDVELPDYAMALYKQLKKDFVLEAGGELIECDNAAVLQGKLEQVANGFIYNNEKIAYYIHDVKARVLKTLIQNMGKTSFVLFYQFEEDKQRIKAVLDSCGVTFATTDKKDGVDAFLAGKIQSLLLHPKSAGHGLNLHTGGCHEIICYCPIWSNDQFKQLVARLWRRGQVHDVRVRTLAAVDTVDYLKLDRVDEKSDFDKAFKQHLSGK